MGNTRPSAATAGTGIRTDAARPGTAPPRPARPVVEHVPLRLAAAEQKRVSRLAALLLTSEPALSATGAFGDRVATGLEDAPALLFEDRSEIALTTASSDTALQYRSLLLAGTDDLVVVSGSRSDAFEAYCRGTLGLGRVTVLAVAPDDARRATTVPQRCAADPGVLGPILRAARRHGRLNLIPYMGTGHVWLLARLLAARSGAQVSVAAAPPRLARRVNDKLWFAARVRELLGGAALPATYHAFGPAALTGRVAALARRGERVVIKVPDSAGSAGNLVLESGTVRALTLKKLRLRILRLLRNLGWVDQFPLLVGVWDCAVLSSPSVQIWVPGRADGPPIVEGLFEQIVEGEAGTFVGAVPCALPRRWRHRMAREAMLLACLLQSLGYFGRCSFDAVLAGEDYASATLHWIECNGRWGGTSIPMTLANRLVGDWARGSMMVVQRSELDHAGCDLPTALARLGPLLFRADGTDSGAIVLSPSGVESGAGMHFLLLGADAAGVRRQAEAVSALFGLESP